MSSINQTINLLMSAWVGFPEYPSHIKRMTKTAIINNTIHENNNSLKDYK